MKDKKPANSFLKKASGAKPPTRAAIKSQQKHGGLGRVGRGLDSLIGPSTTSAEPVPPPVVPLVPPAASASAGERVLQVPPWEIERSPWQPRTEFSREALEDLVESIRQNGIIQPLTCRRRKDGKPEAEKYDFTKWFHDLYRPSLRPYDPKEIGLIKRFNKLADDEFKLKSK